MVQSSWIKTKLWIGEEKEGREKEKRLFVDGAGWEEIKKTLTIYPEVRAVYFGHDIIWPVVRKLVNRVRVIVEVDDADEVPDDLRGKIEVVVRMPKWVDYVKVVDRNKIRVVDLRKDGVVNRWCGRKLYPNDKEVL